MVALVPTVVLRCDEGFARQLLAFCGYGWLPWGPARCYQGPGGCSSVGVQAAVSLHHQMARLPNWLFLLPGRC